MIIARLYATPQVDDTRCVRFCGVFVWVSPFPPPTTLASWLGRRAVRLRVIVTGVALRVFFMTLQIPGYAVVAARTAAVTALIRGA